MRSAIENIFSGYETVIGSTMVVNGELSSTNDARVDGTVTGAVHAKNGLMVGPGGQIVGNISGRSVTIYGKVTGDILADDVMLGATSHVVGDLKARSITTEPGAFLDGKVIMVVDKPESSPVADETAID